MHILKHRITLAPDLKLDLYRGAKFLSFQMQHDRLTSWWLEDTEGEKETATLHVLPTGGVVDDGLTYLGTLQDDSYVWHLFRSA